MEENMEGVRPEFKGYGYVCETTETLVNEAKERIGSVVEGRFPTLNALEASTERSFTKQSSAEKGLPIGLN